MKQMVDEMEQHIKGIIHDCIVRDDTRTPAVAICLTTLPDYLSLDASIHGRIVAKCLKGGNSYKMPRLFTTGRGAHSSRQQDVYVGLKQAVEIARDRAPLMADLVVDVVNEVKES